MKLYEVPRNTWVIPTENTQTPPGAREIDVAEPVFFGHIDGAYSYCKDIHGNVVHLPAWQEVSPLFSLQFLDFLLGYFVRIDQKHILS